MHCGGTGGCRGSIPQLAYNYVQLFGLASDHDYPYWSGVTGITGNCKGVQYNMDDRIFPYFALKCLPVDKVNAMHRPRQVRH